MSSTTSPLPASLVAQIEDSWKSQIKDAGGKAVW